MKNEFINIYSYNNSELVLFFPELFRNKVWAEKFGKIYSLLTDEMEKSNLKKLVLDFQYCKWIDPIPLLSILVFINQKISLPKEKIVFKIPKIDGDTESKVVCKFLNEEGFIDAFERIGIIDSESSNIREQINKTIVKLNYFDCHLLNAQIFDTLKIHESTDEFYKRVNTLINEIEVNLRSKRIPLNKFNDIIYRIRIFLSETINNVYNHAYPDNEERKYIGIYLRYRFGQQNTSIEKNEKSKLKELSIKEISNSSRLLNGLKEIIELREGCIEVFVVDVGIGIADSIGVRNGSNKSFPARSVFVDLFNTEQRKKISSEKNRTKISGLALIGRLLSQEKDFILNKDFEEWLGSILPDIKSNSFFEAINSVDNKHTPGCIWQATFSWQLSSVELENWEILTSKSLNLLKLYKNKQVSIALLEQYTLIDERIIHHPNWKERKLFFESTVKKQKPNKCIIYLPQYGVTKYLIGFVILPYLAEIAIEDSCLVIADIPDEERLTYFAALNEVVYSPEYKLILSKIQRIVLISRSLSICTLTYQKGHYCVDKNGLDEFIFDSLAELSLYKILEVLITNDSILIWQDVLKKKKTLTFINSKIIWNDISKESIDSYLDFNQLCELNTFVELFDVNIQRVLGIYSYKNIQIKNLDILTNNIVKRIQKKLIPSHLDSNFTIFVGSIFVKGYTQEDGAYNIKEDYIVFHCFQHPSSTEESLFKLFYWPKKEWINNNFEKKASNYQRIGRTPAIAQGGWMYYKIPRYDINKKSFYKRNPKLTYLDWQDSKIGLRIGNFKYGSFYDLLKLDLKTIINTAFYYKNDLARFIVSHFFYALGGNISELKDKDYSSDIEENKDELSLYYKDTSIIVYPNHFYTKYVIEKVSEILSDTLISKIIPLNYVRSNHTKTNLLFSPLNFDIIKKYLQGSKKSVVFFDDAIVSGRSRKEVKHLLKHLGANETKTLAIIDRQRLPYAIPNPETHRYYWRLDIPRLGANENNPINYVLKKAKDFQTQFVEEANRRIDVWNLMWGECDTTDENSAHVLSPISINISKPNKKFGVQEVIEPEIRFEQIGGDENRINLYTSVGLLTYCLEIHCITGRDDLIIKYLKQDIPDSVRIELICSHLLLYGNELRPTLKIELLIYLLEATNYFKPDIHTVFAAIVLLNQSDDDIIKLSKQNEFVNNCNFDIHLAFAIHSLIRNKTLENSSKYSNLFQKPMLDNKQRLINWVDFHKQIFEKRKAHITPIHAVINKRKSIENRFIDFGRSLVQLKMHLNEFPINVFSELIPKEKLFKAIDDFKNKSDILLNNKFENNLADLDIIQNEIESTIESELLNPLVLIHDTLFLQINGNEVPLKNFITGLISENTLDDWKTIAVEKNCNAFIDFHEDKEGLEHQIFISSKGIDTLKYLQNNELLPMWIPMDLNLKDNIKNFIFNYLHGSFKLISDPFSSNKVTKAHLWYSFEFNEKLREFKIFFGNPIRQEVNDIDISFKTGKIKNLIKSYQLGCDLSFYYNEDSETKILITELSLPII